MTKIKLQKDYKMTAVRRTTGWLIGMGPDPIAGFFYRFLA
jgi:hypothetical protein